MHEVFEAASGKEGLAIAASTRPHLVVLDLGFLPDLEGIEVCRRLRAWDARSDPRPLARHSESEKTALLDAGADDYVTKPFARRASCRVRAHLRRARWHRFRRRRSAAHRRPGAGTSRATLSLEAPMSSIHADGVGNSYPRWSRMPGETMTHRQLFRAVWGTPRGGGNAQQYLVSTSRI